MARRAEKYLLVMRHGKHVNGTLTPEAREGVQEVARGLASWCDGRFRRQKNVVLDVLTMGSPEVEQTASSLVSEMRHGLARLRSEHEVFGYGEVRIDRAYQGVRAQEIPRGLAGSEGDRDPRALGPYDPDGAAFDDFVAGVCRRAEGGEAEQVSLLVGNDPLLSWLAGRLTGHATPIDRGEVLCLARGRRRAAPWPRRAAPCPRYRWRVAWNLSSTDSVSEITEKIKSKMTTATALGTVIVALATFLLTDPVRASSTCWDWAALGLLGASATLHFFALFHFDTLLMPSRYWGSIFRPNRGRHLQRPPGTTPRLLQYWMVRLWHRLVAVAVILLGLGVLLLAVAAANGPAESVEVASAGRELAPPDTTRAQEPSWLLFAVVPLAAAGLWGWSQRPRLGTSD